MRCLVFKIEQPVQPDTKKLQNHPRYSRSRLDLLIRTKQAYKLGLLTMNRALRSIRGLVSADRCVFRDSVLQVFPVTYADSSCARNTASQAISAGDQWRCYHCHSPVNVE